jgi:NADPH:quinone reductase-like Zn-dependent oxidoreductase
MKLRYKILGGALALLVLAGGGFALYIGHDGPCGVAPTLAAGAQPMKAIVYHCYGSPEVLRLEQIARPVPSDDGVLVRVHAASVNPLDWHYMRGTPFFLRLDAGAGVPKEARLGVDFAGTVAAVGRNVKRFKPGDEVFGATSGAFAEYVSLAESKSLVLKPASVSFEQAAAVPIAAITALQALRDKGAVKPGQRVLINGASGGVGTFAVQIAKALGAEVTGVCSTRNLPMVRTLGADHVIDYSQQDYTRSSQHYDLIVDTVSNHSPAENRRVLTAHGSVVIVGGNGHGKWFGPLMAPIKALVYSRFVPQNFSFMLAKVTPADLEVLRGLMQAGKVTAVIDRRYTLSETPAALTYLEAGHARGKVVIAVE